MKQFKLLTPIIALLLAALLAACSAEEPAPAPDDETRMVEFILGIYAGEPGNGNSGRSRAGEEVVPNDTTYFEPPVTDQERMHTLRVIIVRPNGEVEKNEYISKVFPEAGLSTFGNYRAKVIAGETKRVWLIANEAAVPFNFENINEGSTFPNVAVEAITLSCAPGKPLIDNTGTVKTNLPMSEVFDIPVKALPENGEITEADREQRAELFITRATVKFSFHIKATDTPSSPYTIEEIAIDNVGDRQYFMPNGVTYTPVKYLTEWDPGYDKVSSYSDRWITAYNVPSGAVNSPISFLPGNAFTFGTDYVPNTEFHYAPALYFPETKLAEGKKYVVRIRLDGDKDFCAEAELPNLPSLPRNTHVKVNITLAHSDLRCQVDVVPYTAVPLNPEFGFDELLPRPPAGPGEMPPWVVFPDPDKPDNP